LIELIQMSKVGDVLNFKVLREGREIYIKMKLERS
jgi:hypothetical protein